MNEDKTNSPEPDESLIPPEWTIEIRREGFQYIAEIKLGGAALFKLSTVRAPPDEAAAHRELSDKAKQWVDEYLARNG